MTTTRFLGICLPDILLLKGDTQRQQQSMTQTSLSAFKNLSFATSNSLEIFSILLSLIPICKNTNMWKKSSESFVQNVAYTEDKLVDKIKRIRFYWTSSLKTSTSCCLLTNFSFNVWIISSQWASWNRNHETNNEWKNERKNERKKWRKKERTKKRRKKERNEEREKQREKERKKEKVIQYVTCALHLPKASRVVVSSVSYSSIVWHCCLF